MDPSHASAWAGHVQREFEPTIYERPDPTHDPLRARARVDWTTLHEGRWEGRAEWKARNAHGWKNRAAPEQVAAKEEAARRVGPRFPWSPHAAPTLAYELEGRRRAQVHQFTPLPSASEEAKEAEAEASTPPRPCTPPSAGAPGTARRCCWAPS
mmetsp:Transcript_2009/g.7378  ORF Transcript_2009/g.7378 Transcript_2009/m.7378 type:complete len:154 (+) Transcript_2009:50-511(+)